MIIYINTREVVKEVHLTLAQIKQVNEQLDRCNRDGDDMPNNDFIYEVVGEPIEVLVGGDKWVVFDTKRTDTVFVKDARPETVVADTLLYWELAKQSNHPVYWIDCNRPDETVWYGTMSDVVELLDDGYFPSLFHGPIEPNGKSAVVRVNGKEAVWGVVRWADKGNPPPRLCESIPGNA